MQAERQRLEAALRIDPDDQAARDALAKLDARRAPTTRNICDDFTDLVRPLVRAVILPQADLMEVLDLCPNLTIGELIKHEMSRLLLENYGPDYQLTGVELSESAWGDNGRRYHLFKAVVTSPSWTCTFNWRWEL